MAQRRRSEQRERSTAWMAQFAEAKECTGIVATAQRCSAFIVEMLLLLPSFPPLGFSPVPHLCACHPINTSSSPLCLSLSAEAAIHPLPSSPPHSSPLQLPPFCPPTFQPSKKPTQGQPTPTPRRATPKGAQEAVILLPRKKLRSSTK